MSSLAFFHPRLTISFDRVLSITVAGCLCSRSHSLDEQALFTPVSVRLVHRKVLAMLTEIFMLRLETAARVIREMLPSSESRFVPFKRVIHFSYKDGCRGSAETAREPPE